MSRGLRGMVREWFGVKCGRRVDRETVLTKTRL